MLERSFLRERGGTERDGVSLFRKGSSTLREGGKKGGRDKGTRYKGKGAKPEQLKK